MWYLGTQKIDRENVHTFGQYYVYSQSDGRFENDKIFYEDDRQTLILDGVIFNRTQLMNGQKDWAQVVLKLLQDKTFPDMLRGSFSGAYVTKADGNIFAFTNHTGERQVFYYQNENNTIVTSDFNIFLEQKSDLHFELNEIAMEYILTYGFMLDDKTLYQNVYRIMPGSAIIVKDHALKKICYHRYNNTKVVNMSDEEAIEEIDRRFRNAVKLEFDKDEEYGLRHLADLSGGLDCRVTNYVAQDMGYKNIVNMSYSQEGSNEYKAMMRLNKHLGNELLYYPLDSADFIYDAEKIIKMNYGLCIYSTSTGASKILSYIARDKFGIEHGGLMGDMRDGDFSGPDYHKHRPVDVVNGMRFCKCTDVHYPIDELAEQYENQEIFDIYTRGYLGGLSTQMIRRHFGDYYAPYMDPDFYDFFLSMPLEQRAVRKILHQWIKKCYPQAFEVVDDKNMCRMDASVFKKKCCILRTKIKNRIYMYGAKFGLFYKQNNMNPFTYWYKTNSKFKNFILTYCNDNMPLLTPFPGVRENAEKIMQQGSVREKTQVLSLLASVKIYG